MADDNAVGHQHLVNHAEAEGEAIAQPDHEAADLGGKAVAAVGRDWSVAMPAGYLTVRRQQLSPANLTVPRETLFPSSQ